MGYPKKYVGHYHLLAEWLSKKGFKVYPMEMFCKPVLVEKPVPKDVVEWHRKRGYSETETHYLYGNVDVVAWKNGKLWAFEVKNQGDKVKTAVAQTKNYVTCFDYVCVVADDLKELTKYREDFRTMGVGTYHWLNNDMCLLDEPKLQNPNLMMRNKLYDRFLRNTGMKRSISLQNPFKTSLEPMSFSQLTLDDAVNLA